MTILTAQLAQGFTTQFNTKPTNFYFAPGRINLIGEHLDYNGGTVLPCAISLGTYAAVKPRTDSKLRLYSANFAQSGQRELDLADLHLIKENTWVNYVIGMILVLRKRGCQIDHGFDIFIQGDLPNSAGLSSSASLELLIGIILQQQCNLAISLKDLALVGKDVENNYIGVNSGIMDQYAIALGQKDKALMLDTATMAYRYVPIELGDYKIVIMNSNQPRALAGSKYNDRRTACEKALEILKKKLPIKTLAEVTPQQLDENSYLLIQTANLGQTRHVVWEQQRTLQAEKALQKGDLTTFGHLLNASHVSLETDFDVTGPALDTLVHTAWANGALGARMTGAGFGGCAIALVETSKIEQFVVSIGEVYEKKMKRKADFYVAQIAAGPHEIRVSEAE